MDVPTGNTFTYPGVITGASGSIQKTDAGTFTFSGSSPNTYGGQTVISAGTLSTTTANVLSSASQVNLVSNLVLNGNNQTIGSLLGSGTVSLGAAQLTLGGDNTDTNFSGTITGATGSIVKLGAGNWTLSGSTQNTYGGQTLISTGTVSTTTANILSSSSQVNLVSNLTLNGNNQTIGSLLGSGTLSLGAAQLTLGGDNTSTTFSGIITGAGGSIVKQGSGTFTLTASSTYNTTTIQAGRLNVISPANVTTNVT
ncbi:MAG TPA: autotransporter-associated beta strand repeat-containing protein, partial [Chlamydiales bacterium]|nr:autotransporter-associated beta strand repeat-containing protein [Chlamydiales bacterium]